MGKKHGKRHEILQWFDLQVVTRTADGKLCEKLVRVSDPVSGAGKGAGNVWGVVSMVNWQWFNGILWDLMGFYGGLMGFNGIYPLVKVNITMENHHVS